MKKNNNWKDSYNRSTHKTVRKDTRNYKCPRCGGEFNTFSSERVSRTKKCPFCGLEKFSFEEENDE